MKRKVYVMDCGDFVKIGVSGNVEQRATQIPYKVNRIYSTDEMEDAFKLEREMHMLFDKNRVPEVQGREYFNIRFCERSFVGSPSTNLSNVIVSTKSLALSASRGKSVSGTTLPNDSV